MSAYLPGKPSRRTRSISSSQSQGLRLRFCSIGISQLPIRLVRCKPVPGLVSRSPIHGPFRSRPARFSTGSRCGADPERATRRRQPGRTSMSQYNVLPARAYPQTAGFKVMHDLRLGSLLREARCGAGLKGSLMSRGLAPRPRYSGRVTGAYNRLSGGPGWTRVDVACGDPGFPRSWPVVRDGTGRHRRHK